MKFAIMVILRIKSFSLFVLFSKLHNKSSFEKVARYDE